MATKLSDYQVQAKRRLKKALGLRASADRKARTLALRLMAALNEANMAGDHLDTLNSLYGTAYAQRTDLTDFLLQNQTVTIIEKATLNTVAGSPDNVYVAVVNNKSGIALAADPDLD